MICQIKKRFLLLPIFIFVIFGVYGRCVYAEPVIADFDKDSVIETIKINDVGQVNDKYSHLNIYPVSKNGMRFVFGNWMFVSPEVDDVMMLTYDGEWHSGFSGSDDGVFNGGVAKVQKNSRFGLINEDYEWIASPIYINLRVIFGDKYFGWKGYEKTGDVIDKDGNIIYSAENKIYPYGDEYALEFGENETYILDSDFNKTLINKNEDTSVYYDSAVSYAGKNIIMGQRTEKKKDGTIDRIFEWYDMNGEMFNSLNISEYIRDYCGYDTDYTRITSMNLENGILAFCFYDNLENVYFAKPSGEVMACAVSDIYPNGTDKNLVRQISAYGDDCIYCDTRLYDLSDGVKLITEFDLPSRSILVYRNDTIVLWNFDYLDDFELNFYDTITIIRKNGLEMDYNPRLVDFNQVPDYEVSELKVYLNGREIELENEPIFKETGYAIMIPAREIFEKLGAEVLWDDETQEVCVQKQSLKFTFHPDSNTVYLCSTPTDFEILNMSDDAVLENDSVTYVPLDIISKAFGYLAEYDEEKNSIYIKN